MNARSPSTFGSIEPQRAQKPRKVPGEDSKRAIPLSPRSTRKPAVGAATAVE
jgi:hypothetical protein